MEINIGSWRDIYSALFPVLGLAILLFGIWWTRPNKVVAVALKDIPKEALIKAQVAAKELMTLKPNTNMEVFSKGRAATVEAGSKYKAAIKVLQKEHLGKKTKRGIQINSLIRSLNNGKSILDVCNRNDSITAFKNELDKNSEEIIRRVDALIRDKAD